MDEVADCDRSQPTLASSRENKKARNGGNEPCNNSGGRENGDKIVYQDITWITFSSGGGRSGKLEQTICCGRCLIYGKERIMT